MMVDYPPGLDPREIEAVHDEMHGDASPYKQGDEVRLKAFPYIKMVVSIVSAAGTSLTVTWPDRKGHMQQHTDYTVLFEHYPNG